MKKKKKKDINNKVYTIRGKQVMLDRDLADLYEVETRYLNKAVKRNIDRFPESFMFQLNTLELKKWKFQIGTSNSNIRKGLRKRPYAFTEQGVAMLSGVLKSKNAIKISISIIEAFVAMRHFLLENKSIFHKFQQIDQKFIEYDENFNKIFSAIESKQLTPNQGIFYDGQIYEAYKFIVDLIEQAEKEIILIDNFIDESVLTLLSNKNKNTTAIIYTKEITDKLLLAEKKFNKQYGNLRIKIFTKSHDRFLVIDNNTYHIGASLKDLGKKWFAFCKLNLDLNPKLNNR
ncbi:MAG: ORF6N domain-containing protein [Candidatus Woesearchaeota archaeon]